MEWIANRAGLYACRYKVQCKIYCPHWQNSKKGECGCDDIDNEKDCLAKDKTSWDATKKECRQGRVCPDKACPDKSPLTIENDCQCKCETGTTWNAEKWECYKTQTCEPRKCRTGQVQNSYDCKCQDDEKECAKFDDMEWIVDQEDKGVCER